MSMLFESDGSRNEADMVKQAWSADSLTSLEEDGS